MAGPLRSQFSVSWAFLACLGPAAAAAVQEEGVSVTPGLSAEPAWIVEGEEPIEFFGNSLAAADVNGDGFVDVLAGAPLHDALGSHKGGGQARLFSGTASGPSTTFTPVTSGTKPFEAAGWSLDSAGDVNGDGYEDVVVGVLGTSQRVEVFHGSASGLSATPVATLQEGVGEFGKAVAGVGDVNGDGFDDVVVGDRNHENPLSDTAYEGAAYLYLGSPDGLSTTPAWTGQVAVHYAFLGTAVAAAGDVDGDGLQDVIVGSQSGAYVYHGTPSGLTDAPAWRTTASPPTHYGDSVAGVGDVDGDGYDDVLVGQPGGASGNPGRVFLFLGSPQGLRPAPAWVAEGVIHPGGGVDAAFGTNVGRAGDVDGDGFDDLLVASAGPPGSGIRRVLVYRGSPTGPSDVPATVLEAAYDFGADLSPAGDIDGDGRDDVLVGGPDIGAGTTFLFLGQGPPLPWSDVAGGGTPGLAGTPDLTLAGPLTAGSFVKLELTGAAPSSLVVLLVASDSMSVPFLGGTLHAFPPDDAAVLVTSPLGELHRVIAFPGLPAGSELWVQAAVVDPSVPLFGAALSDAVKGVVP